MFDFDHTHNFEEFPVSIGDVVVMEVTGRACLKNDPDFGGGSYGFIVTGIELTGSHRGDWRDTRYVVINDRSDDEFDRLLFRRIAAALQKDEFANECFAAALEDYRSEAA